MITFILISVILFTALACALGGIAVIGAIASGVVLIVLDIAIGVSPFVLAFLAIRWLLGKRG